MIAANGFAQGVIDYEANLRALYYDLAGAHSPEVIRMLLTITTPDHLLYGSDYPYVAPQVLKQSLARMKDYLSKEPDLAPFKEMILWKNAKWLLGQTGEKPSAATATANMIVRIAEIEVFPQYLEEYLAFANEVDRLSIEREPGVICLFPMQSAEDSCQIRILEIYASEEAYQLHLKTPHFLKPHGERPQATHHEATRPRDDETDIQKTEITMQKILSFLAVMLFCSCSADNEVKAEVPTMNQIYITIGGQTQSVTLVDNDATHELVAALQNAPITVTLNDNNFEIWGPLGRSLTTNNEQMTAQPGNIVLYNGSNICIFYSSNSWSYTRLGKIDNLSESVTLSLSSGTTAIKSINGHRLEDGAYYSLNGVKVDNPSKGLYIKNGKKVIL